MDDFSRRRAEDRAAYIEETASKLDLEPMIIEKDFWVCWTLRRLMNCKELSDHLTFKGGTSLSKAYNIIHRFSEDIDLTIAKSAPLICKVADPMDENISGKEQKRRVKALKNAAQKYVMEILAPALASEIGVGLGTGEGWKLVTDPKDSDGQTLLFHYPRNNQGGNNTDYIQPRIKLEFGARGETEPCELKTISPYLALHFPDKLPDAQTVIRTLAATRTFWEKATILHAFHHKGELKNAMSRHYYDILMLAESGIADCAHRQPGLFAQVVRNKRLMFADNKASYETAVIGSLRLFPSDKIKENLESDYGAMNEMFMQTPPSFEELMMGIAKLEKRLNKV